MRSKAMAFIFMLVAILATSVSYGAAQKSNLQITPQSTLSNSTASPIVHIVIVGAKKNPEAKKLHDTAATFKLKGIKIDWWEKNDTQLKNSIIQYPTTGKAAAYVCFKAQCSLPLFEPSELIEYFNHIKPQIVTVNKSQTIVKSYFSSESLLTEHHWIFIVIGFTLIGVLLSFSPCLLPLLPIMASIIVGQTIGVKKSRTFFLCLAYVLSMSATYSLLGLTAGTFGLYLQIYMQSTWIIILFSMIFFLLGLSMLGAYELKVPQRLQNKIHGRSSKIQGGNYLGVICMGVLATLIISPCVTAPLAAILSYIANTSDYVLGAIALFFLGIGMGVPLLIICVFSKDILPKVVHWNSTIRNGFGLILFAMAIWLASRVIPNQISLLLWSSLLILTSIYMGIHKNKTRKWFGKFWKMMAIMVLLYGVAIFFYTIFMTSNLYHTLIKVNLTIAVNESLQTSIPFVTIRNQTELDRELVQAQKNHMPVLLKFTAQWCVACKAMDRDVYAKPEVALLLDKFRLLQIDLTKADPESIKLTQTLGVIGPPAALFFDKNGNLSSMRAPGEVTSSAFLKILNTIINQQ